MAPSPTRFFCRCGRLITVDGAEREVFCPTCRTRNSVPGATVTVAPPAAKDPFATERIPSLASRPPPPAPNPAASVSALMELRVGGKLGRFELVRVLGHGGMGTVYHARETESGRDLALKILHPALHGRPDFVSRFQREARSASALNHENIVRVVDSGVDRGIPWIAMELLEGEDLLAAAQRGVVTPENAAACMLQAARGLAAAAAIGITHRDVKPGNLVLKHDGVLKIADFGLAKEVDSSSHLTVTGEVLGTPHYMSPEQGRGERADHRSDLYSLGATFYHVLGGVPPHEADTPVAVIMKHLREEPAALRSRNGRVTPGLERVVHRLLQKSAEQRYQSYAALIGDLERVQRGEEPIAGADPPARRVQSGDTTYLIPDLQPTELVLKPAGFLRRLFAFVVDLVAVDVVLKIGLFLVRAAVPSAGLSATGAPRSFRDFLFPILDFKRLGDPAAGFTILALLCTALAYFVGSDARGGRTLGKRWLSLRVCRRDGGDLGVLRSLVRTIVLFPAIALMLPTTVAGLFSGTAIGGGSGFAPGQALLLGVGWILALWIVGQASAAGRPLQDALVDAVAYRAQRQQMRNRVVASRRSLTTARALKLSVIPGLGIMYAGKIFVGMLCLAAVVALLFSHPPFAIALWVASAAYARRLVERAHRGADAVAPALAPDVDVRRSES